MKINNKGLTNKRIHELIDKEIEFNKWIKKVCLPMYVQTEAIKIYSSALKEMENKKEIK